MHILAIGWIYVVSMMALTEPTVTAGLMTFIWYCVLPLGLLTTFMRKNKSAARQIEKNKLADTPPETEHGPPAQDIHLP